MASKPPAVAVAAAAAAAAAVIKGQSCSSSPREQQRWTSKAEKLRWHVIIKQSVRHSLTATQLSSAPLSWQAATAAVLHHTAPTETATAVLLVGSSRPPTDTVTNPAEPSQCCSACTAVLPPPAEIPMSTSLTQRVTWRNTARHTTREADSGRSCSDQQCIRPPSRHPTTSAARYGTPPGVQGLNCGRPSAVCRHPQGSSPR